MRKKETAFFTGLAIVFIAVLGLVAMPLYPDEGNGESTSSSSQGVSSTLIRGSTIGGEGLHYNVTFYDSGPCNAHYPTGPFFSEWGVQLGNWYLTEPSNITLSQIPENGYSGGHSNVTKITFSVPVGTYNFTVYPTAFMTIDSPNGFTLSGPSGVVTVTDSNATIYTGGSNALACGW